MEEVKTGKLDDILNIMRDVQSKNAYPVYIPSLKKEVLFKEITTGQEKAIVKTIIDNPVYNSEFIFAIKNVIKENCLEEIDVDNLSLIDKTSICLTMRAKSIGNEMEYSFEKVDKVVLINLDEYIERFKKMNYPENKKINSGNYTIECSVPTISTEFNLEREFRSNVDNLKIDSVEGVRDAIGDAFINELVKYIKKITIRHGDSEIELDMNSYTFTERVKIVEEIGNKATKEILEYIDAVNNEITNVLSIEAKLNKQEKDKYKIEKLTSILETGSDFFTTY